MIKSKLNSHDVEIRDGVWVYSETGIGVHDKTLEYTPELSGSGQFGVCRNCKKTPTKEGHDGCLGTLVDHNNGGIMNACCGHGKEELAYIQYWDQTRISGEEAANKQKQLLSGDKV